MYMFPLQTTYLPGAELLKSIAIVSVQGGLCGMGYGLSLSLLFFYCRSVQHLVTCSTARHCWFPPGDGHVGQQHSGQINIQYTIKCLLKAYS